MDSGTETMPDFVDIIEKKQCVVSPCACVPVPEYVCVCVGGGLPSLSPSLCVSYEDAHAHVAIC